MANDAHISQLVLEMLIPTSAPAQPGRTPNDGSDVWIASIDTVSAAGAGKACLSIKLADNKSIAVADGFLGKWVYSALVPVSVPNNVVFGGMFNWTFSNKSPNLQFIVSMGVQFYDVNKTFIAENTYDFNSSTDGTNSWVKIPEISILGTSDLSFTSNAAFARYVCYALVSAVGTTVDTGVGNNFGTMLFDNLYIVQQIGNTGNFAPGGGGLGVPTPVGGAPHVQPGGDSAVSVTNTGGHLSYATTVGGHITWNWTGVTLFWSDGSTTIIPDGSVTQDGLTDGLLYYYFPYVDVASKTLQWLSGGSGGVSGGGVGGFTDDFSTGTLNPALWVIDTGSAPGNNSVNIGTFSAGHVSLSQGMLDLKLTQTSASGVVTSIGAEVRSIATYGYGTYEWVYRASTVSTTPNGAGSSVSGSDSGGFTFINDSQTEIDFEVEGQFPTQLELTNWATTASHDYTPFTMANASLAFHTYKFVWTPGRIVYYLDGVQISTHLSAIPSTPAFVLMNHWGTNATSFGGLATVGTDRHLYVSKFTYTPTTSGGTGGSGGIAFPTSTAGEIASQSLAGRVPVFPSLSAGTSGGPPGGGF